MSGKALLDQFSALDDPRHMSLNLIRGIDDKASLKVRRKTLGWDDDYLHTALTGNTS